MPLVEVVVRLVSLLLHRGLDLLAEDDHLLEEEHMSALGSGEEGPTGATGILPHLESIGLTANIFNGA